MDEMNVDLDPVIGDSESHSCQEEADDNGICSVCGCILLGSFAFYEYLADHRFDFI